MSIADEFLADLDEDEDGNNEENNDDLLRDMMEEMEGGNNEEDDYVKRKKNRETMLENLKSNDLNQIKHLVEKEELNRHMEKIDILMNISEKEKKEKHLEEEEYQVIVDSNQYLVDIVTDIHSIHKYVKQMYGKKFPELEQFVPKALDYLRVVQKIKNETNINNVDLDGLLDGPTLMVVKVTSSTSNIKKLDEVKLNNILEACELGLDFNDKRQNILNFVESKMSSIAPNLSAYVGTSIAAKLIGAAGGLQQLSKLPASTIQILGKNKKSKLQQNVFSDVNTVSSRHFGYIYQCDLIQQLCPPGDIRKRACRAIATKSALCARIDSFKSSPKGEVGEKHKNDLIRKINKWKEPPPAKLVRALDIPGTKKKRTRGGKRFRKMKQRQQISELHKQANRMRFGDVTDDNADFESIGMLNNSHNHVRLHTTQTTLVTSQSKKKKLQNQQYAIINGTTTAIPRSAINPFMSTGQTPIPGINTSRTPADGLTSTFAFTPLEGIELIDPNLAQQKVNEANNRYFSDIKSFKKPSHPSTKK